MLLGTGVWWIRPGANVTPDFSQKYFAIYSQNDWRATLEADGQPRAALGECSRGRPSGSTACRRGTSTAQNAFGTPGRHRLPRRRRLQPQPVGHDLRQLGTAGRRRVPDGTTAPCCAAAIGVTYLPTNTGYFSGPIDYGVANFSAGVQQQVRTARRPAGVPVIRFSDPASDLAGDRRQSRMRRRSTASAKRASTATSRTARRSAVELLHRARARRPLDDVDRLQRVDEPRPAQPLVPDPEPAEHRSRRRSIAVARRSSSPATAR